MTDEGAYIATNDAYDKVHAASLTFATHNAIGYVAYQDACENRPSCKICDMF